MLSEPLTRPCLLSATSPVPMASVASHWLAPEEGRYKLNTDGARCNTDGFASCGCVVRDALGAWKFGFSKFIGMCEVLEAELWGVVTGLRMAWDRGLRRIILEVDSADAVRSIQNPDRRSISHLLVACAVELLGRN
ncbi:hypothetical protein V6N13_048300 [Hibiscus sabdariffa]|uniref:RNase H type-1 domain-containing protein n=1 Tax=Hibiscus sabdariffa TaxID=183260 RepID=A0ABR2F6T5_9ROSI